MSDESELNGIEKRWGEAMQRHSLPGCLDGQTIIEIAMQGKRGKDYAARMEHIALCSHCRQLVRDTRQLSKIANSQALPDASQPVTAYWTRIRQRLFLSGALGVAFAAGVALFFVLPRQPGKDSIAQQSQLIALQRAGETLQEQNRQLRQKLEDQQQKLEDQQHTDSVTLQSALRNSEQTQKRLRASELAQKKLSETSLEAEFGKLLASAHSNSQDLKGLDNGRTSRMGTERLDLISPCAQRVGGLPEFLWKPLPAATHYRLTLKSMHDGTKLYQFDELKEPRLELPVTDLLRPGAYEWTVEAYSKDAAASPDSMLTPITKQSAQFVVTAPAETKFRKTLVEMCLRLARYYRKAGLLDHARQQYRSALEADPTNTEARKALQN